MQSSLRFLFCILLVLVSLPSCADAGIVTTTIDGNLIFEALEGHGATSNQEFGLGTPSTDSLPQQRMIIFIIHLVNEEISSVTPARIVNLGFFPAGSALDFYNFSDFGGPHWAFSSHLKLNPSQSDLEVFTDRDNSLGMNGSVVERIGVDHWILHLDDAASVDDDDNEMIIRVQVQSVPEPFTVVLVLAGAGCLVAMKTKLTRARRSPAR